MIKVDELMKILDKRQTVFIFEENTNVTLYCTDRTSLSRAVHMYNKVKDKEVVYIVNDNGDCFDVYIKINEFRQ